MRVVKTECIRFYALIQTSNKIESLPIELRSMLLVALDDVVDLKSASKSCLALHHAFSDYKRDYSGFNTV